jgi:ABC-2 type transport system permease protein
MSDVSSNAPPESMPAAAPPPTRPFLWSVRRELWENRSIYVAPLAVAALILAAALVGAIGLPGRLASAPADPAGRREFIERPYMFAALLLMFITSVVGIYYCVEALQSERRDRSILFWKSLPVSDATTVLSKASIPFVVIPLVTLAVTVGTQSAMLLVRGVRLLGSGTAAAPWMHVHLFRMWVLLFYHLFAFHSLWWAPLWGWLLLVSAWSRRAAFLWATLPLLALGLLEKIAFNTAYFASFLKSRFLGGPGHSGAGMRDVTMASLTPEGPVQFLTSPGLWLGLLFAAACLAAAVKLRRRREPL